MFCIDQLTADLIRKAFDEGGESAAIAELRRHFQSVPAEHARNCVRAIASWHPAPSPAELVRGARKPAPSRRR